MCVCFSVFILIGTKHQNNVKALNPVILLLQPLVCNRGDLLVLLIKWKVRICQLLGKENWIDS